MSHQGPARHYLLPGGVFLCRFSLLGRFSLRAVLRPRPALDKPDQQQLQRRTERADRKEGHRRVSVCRKESERKAHKDEEQDSQPRRKIQKQPTRTEIGRFASKRELPRNALEARQASIRPAR